MSVATCKRACAVRGLLRCWSHRFTDLMPFVEPVVHHFSLPLIVFLSTFPLSPSVIFPCQNCIFSPPPSPPFLLYFTSGCVQERWTPAVWRHHKVTRNLRHKIHMSQWCKPRAPLSLRSTSAFCSHSVYTAQLQGKHSTGRHYPSTAVCKTAFNYSLSCVFIIL